MRFVSRAAWGARPPLSPAAAIDSTVTTGHWEGSALWGGVIGDHASCATKVRAIQAYHMDHQGWQDLAYNAVSCPHGYVFEGRGPQRRSAANGTNTANGASAVVCYLGGEGDPFTDLGKTAMDDAAAWLGDPIDRGHRDWFATACPGDEIYGWIRSGHPNPTPPTEDDMTPAQCRDHAPAKAEGGANRKWFFWRGPDHALHASVPAIGGAANDILVGGAWAGGFQAMTEDTGLLVVVGVGVDGQGYQALIYTDGNTVKPAGTPPEIIPLGFHPA